MARGAGSGLPTTKVPVYVGGSLDTKSNPKLVQPGALLELENLVMLKTGEMRLRNGFAQASASSVIGSGHNLYPIPAGGLGAVAPSQAVFPWAAPFKFSTQPVANPGWTKALFALGTPYPIQRARVSSLAASALYVAGGGPVTSAVDLADPDLAIASGGVLSTWTEVNAAGLPRVLTRSADDDRVLNPVTRTNVATNGRPPVCVAGGSSFLCNVYVETATNNVTVDTRSTAGLITGTTTIAATSAGQPWVDAKPIPGGNLIAIAYRAAAGGVSCVVFDPTTRTVTVGPVNTAGADASFCLGWLDDQLATGNLYLATVGSASGAVVRTMNPATLAVTATNVIDATATANVRNVTGHINASATDYVVLWDVTNATALYNKVRVGRWTGAAAVFDLAPSWTLYSRSWKDPTDGRYYFLGAYDSTVQPLYSVLGTDDYDINIRPAPASQCQILAGEGGGRRTVQCSLSSPCVSGSNVLVAVAQKAKISTPADPVAQGRSVVVVTITSSLRSLFRPRELGGTLFLPGGLLQKDDGTWTTWATFPFYPETPSLASSATGSMTPSGTYSYKDVYRRVDSSGRVLRSAPSVPVAVTLGAGDGRVTLTCPNPRLPPQSSENLIIEHYRAGPAEALDTNYNKVGETYCDATTGDTVAFIDSMSDANAELGELLYATGNVLENFPPPSCNLLEVCGGRVWVVNAERPDELWPSLEYEPRQGIRFNPLIAFRVTGDGFGAITALAAMDGRLIVFKSQAIYVVSGDGPNEANQGQFNPPQAVSLTVGTVNPGSVIATPDGIMFQAASGIWLLDRGLGLSYIGKEVEQYTLAASVVDAALVTGMPTVRFVFASGRMIEWDYHHKRWYTHQLRVGGSTVVACANSPLYGWCYLLATGVLMVETPGVYTDVLAGSAAIVPRISFPHLNLAGLNGYQRVRGFQLLLDVVGNHTLSIDAEYDYSGAVTGTPRTIALTTATPSTEVEYNPPEGKAKCTSIRPVITTSVQAAGSGAFRLTGLSLMVGVKPRGTNVPATSRAT